MKYDNIDIEIKIGQLIVAGFKGTEGNCARMITRGHIGNVILFSRNIKSAEQTARLTQGLQELCLKENGLPAFITADQECGSVDRFQGAITPFPGNMAVSAAVQDPEEVSHMGEMLGKELRSLGIHIDFAPCMDVICNPKNTGIGVRSYGADPKRVAELGSAMIKGLEKGGVLGCAKHFPGSGDTETDAHIGLPILKHSINRLDELELHPFKYAIENGCPMVMAGHLITECIDQEHPASVSKAVITGLLRERLGFTGLVITDCLEMGAITERYGTAKAAVMAIKAGADMVCISHTYERQLEAAVAIKAAVLSGELPIKRLNEAFERVMRAKEKAGLWERNRADISATVSKKEHKDFARKLYNGSIATIRGRWFLPDSENTIVAGPEFRIGNPAEDEPKATPDFAQAIGALLGTHHITFDPDITKDGKDTLIQACSTYMTVILGMTEAGVHKSQRELYRRLTDAGKRVLAVSLRTPYDLDGETAPACHVATFEYTHEALTALSRLFKENREPAGRNPRS